MGMIFNATGFEWCPSWHDFISLAGGFEWCPSATYIWPSHCFDSIGMMLDFPDSWIWLREMWFCSGLVLVTGSLSIDWKLLFQQNSLSVQHWANCHWGSCSSNCSAKTTFSKLCCSTAALSQWTKKSAEWLVVRRLTHLRVLNCINAEFWRFDVSFQCLFGSSLIFSFAVQWLARTRGSLSRKSIRQTKSSWMKSEYFSCEGGTGSGQTEETVWQV